MTSSALHGAPTRQRVTRARRHVLILPSWYPSKEQPIRGIFFREQASALASSGVVVGVVFAEQRTLRSFSAGALLENHWQLSSHRVDGITELRRHSWSLRPREAFRRLWVGAMVRLGQKYVARHGRPDVLHVQSSVSGAEAGQELAAELGIPFVVTEHRSLFLQPGWTPPRPERTRDAIRAALHVSAVSRRLARAVETFVPGMSCSVLPNFVDSEFFGAAALRSRARSEFRILTACALFRRKGVDVLIRAFAQAFAAESRARLVIAGEGPERSALERLVRQCGLVDRVDFLGILNRQELLEELARASIFALASHAEPFGVVVIEALSAGLPVVATRSGGPDDILTPDIGWLVAPGDVQELSAALAEACARVGAIDRRAIAASAHERYGRESFVARVLKFYDGAN